MNDLLYRNFLGFDKIIDEMNKTTAAIQKQTSFPPYNIRKIDENKYIVELAVAGFSKSDIEIEIADDILKISGNTSEDDDNFLFRGIAKRNWTRQFNLADTIEIQDASLVNGILKVFLENIIPDSKKPRKIDITDSEGDKPEMEQLNG